MIDFPYERDPRKTMVIGYFGRTSSWDALVWFMRWALQNRECYGDVNRFFRVYCIITIEPTYCA